MKISVSSYSFGSYLSDEKLGVMGVIDWLADNGFDGIEFVDAKWSNNFDPEIAKRIVDHCGEKGIEICAYCTGANLLGANIKDEIDRLKKNVDYAALLGVKNMRHDVTGGFTDGRKICRGFDDALPIIVPLIREIADYAESKGVGTMSENHGYFVQGGDRLEKLVNTVAHKNYGALVDIGNFMCADEDPAVAVSKTAPYAKHVHAKDFIWKSGVEGNPGDGWFRTRALNYLRGTVIGHGDAKVYQSIQILKQNGYDGYVSIEFEGWEDNLRAIRAGGDNLRRFIG